MTMEMIEKIDTEIARAKTPEGRYALEQIGVDVDRHIARLKATRQTLLGDASANLEDL